MAYLSNSTDLVTLAEVKAINNIALTTTDTFITALIPSVCRAVENYLRRRLVKQTWAQWYPVNQEVILAEWPVNNILYVGMPIQVFTVNDSTNSYTFSITQPNSRSLNVVGKFTAVNNSTLVVTDYLFSTYQTLGALKTAVETTLAPVTFTYTTNANVVSYSAINTMTLRASTGYTFDCGYNVFKINGVQQNQMYRLSDTSDRLIFNPNMAVTSGLYQYGFGQYSTGYASIDSTEPLDWLTTEDVLVIWDAGYATADVPSELKWIISSIIRDILSLYDADGNGSYKGIYKSEMLGDYQYTLFPEANLSALINEKYSKSLDYYKRKVV